MTEDQIKKGSRIVATIEKLRMFAGSVRQYDPHSFNIAYDDLNFELRWATELHRDLDAIKQRYIEERVAELQSELYEI